jgi:hypothetical protein
VDPTRWDRRLVAITTAASTLVLTAVMIVHPPPWPGLLAPGAPRAAGGSAAPVTAPPAVTVDAGDGRLHVSWTSDPGRDDHVQAVPETVPETVGAAALACRPVPPASPFTASCLVQGVVNGAAYLVSLYQGVDTDAGVPLRTVRAVPRPKLLSGPDTVLWLDPSNGGSVEAAGGPPVLGAAVAAVRDGSTYRRNAVQSEAARRPTLTQIGLRAALGFDGADSLLMDGRGLPTGTSTVFVVAAQDDPRPDLSCFRHVLAWGSPQPGQGRILHKGCRTSAAFAETFGSYQLQQPTLDWPTGQPALVSAVFDGDGTGLRLDEAPSYRWTAPPQLRRAAVPGPSAVLGAAPWDLQAGWQGRIGEVVVIDRALTGAETTSMEDYLTTKWQVPLRPDAG